VTRARHAFTLIEMLASLAIMSLAFGAMLSASMLLVQTVDPESRATRTTALAPLAADLAEDLQTATAIAATADSIELTVPDRDGDGAEETLRYAWSGTPGDPLTLAYNGATPAAVSGPLDAFAVAFEATSDEEPVERLIAAHNPSSLDSPGTVRMNNDNWHGQIFTPDLPPGATGWKPTRARFIAENKSGTTTLLDAFFTAINRVAADGSPTTTAYTFVPLSPDSLADSMRWHESSFSSLAPVITAGEDALFNITTLSGAVEVDVLVDKGDSAPAGYVEGEDDFELSAGRALVYEVYGLVYGVTTRIAYRAHVRLEPADAGANVVEFGVNTLNEPFVTRTPTLLPGSN